MALLERVSTLVRANINDLVDKAEDPEKMIKQVILDMQNQLLQVKTQVAISIADQHVLDKKLSESEESGRQWMRRAEMAVDKKDENVSIHVHQGEFVSVVGLNGAGKTTLFNTISGFLPYTGKIVRDGEKLRGTSPARIARSGIVQCPESRELFGEMSVRENLDLGGQHLSNEDKDKQLAWLFELFPILKERQSQIAQTLSGGEQQMLAIGRALMMQPKILILDEPTLGLAPVILEQLSKALEKLRQTTPITVLLGEQNVTFALPHADRVYVLEHARIVWEGDPGRFAAEAGEGYL